MEGVRETVRREKVKELIDAAVEAIVQARRLEELESGMPLEEFDALLQETCNKWEAYYGEMGQRELRIRALAKLL